jgi:hypothetical protein
MDHWLQVIVTAKMLLPQRVCHIDGISTWGYPSIRCLINKFKTKALKWVAAYGS